MKDRIAVLFVLLVGVWCVSDAANSPLQSQRSVVRSNPSTSSRSTQGSLGGPNPTGSRLLPSPDLQLLSSEQVQFFIENGYLHLKSGLSSKFNKALFKQLRHLHRDEFNPGNNIVPRIDKLQTVLKDGHVRGALTSILGPDFMLHPHRHVHESFPGKETQPLHQDTYFDYFQEHHHTPQWAMIFYYPQDTTIEMGPTSIVNKSQYNNVARPSERLRQPLLVKAGDFVLLHYNTWHGAGANTLGPPIPGTQWRNSKDLIFMKRADKFPSDPNLYRYMIKFQFVRHTQPGISGPTWRFDASQQQQPGANGGPDSDHQLQRRPGKSCDLPCEADPTGLGDGVCDDVANNCRCSWDGGDCDDHTVAPAELSADDPQRASRQNSQNEYTPPDDYCDLDALVNDRQALRTHIWQWLSGGRVEAVGDSPHSYPPCRSTVASANLLEASLPALAAQMRDQAVVSAKIAIDCA